jgi:hypothetical protein
MKVVEYYQMKLDEAKTRAFWNGVMVGAVAGGLFVYLLLCGIETRILPF